MFFILVPTTIILLSNREKLDQEPGWACVKTKIRKARFSQKANMFTSFKTIGGFQTPSEEKNKDKK